MRLLTPNQRAFVSDLAEEEIRGTALGTFHMLTSIAALPAGLVGCVAVSNPVQMRS